MWAQAECWGDPGWQHQDMSPPPPHPSKSPTSPKPTSSWSHSWTPAPSIPCPSPPPHPPTPTPLIQRLHPGWCLNLVNIYIFLPGVLLHIFISTKYFLRKCPDISSNTCFKENQGQAQAEISYISISDNIFPGIFLSQTYIEQECTPKKHVLLLFQSDRLCNQRQ